MAQSVAYAPKIIGLDSVESFSTSIISVDKFVRPDGEIHWRHPRHRIVIPLTGVDARSVTVQLEGSHTREFVWHNGFGFYPAGTEARIASTAATSLQILWTPDPETAGSLEPLLPHDDPFILANAHAIARELGGGALDPLFVDAVGNAIIIKLTRHFTGARAQTPRASGLSRERMRRVVEYIDAHLGNELSLDALASVACLSSHHLSRSFHRAMGVGLHRYVVQRRVERAKHLVLGSNLSMAEIAWAVGFGSQAAFTKRFHQEVGQAPARLRRSA